MSRRPMEAGAAAAVVGLGILEAAHLIDAHGPGTATLTAPGPTAPEAMVQLRRAYLTAGAVLLVALTAAAWLARDARILWVGAGGLVFVALVHEVMARRSA